MTVNSFQQKIILISGATSGIGKATALLLASHGYRVYAGYRNPEKGNALLKEAKKTSLPLSIVSLDVTSPDSIKKAVETVLKDGGRIDVLINNAGYGLAGSFRDLEIDEIKAQFETNVFGQIALTKEILSHMMEKHSGTILNVASMAGRMAYPLFGAYCASKHALEAFSESLRLELKPFGIRTVVLEPGMIKTGFVKKGLLFAKKATDEKSPYYKPAMATKDLYYKKDNTALSVDVVAKKILKIIESKNPKLRYQVGMDSFLFIICKRLLPGAWFESILGKVLGVNRYHV